MHVCVCVIGMKDVNKNRPVRDVLETRRIPEWDHIVIPMRADEWDRLLSEHPHRRYIPHLLGKGAQGGFPDWVQL